MSACQPATRLRDHVEEYKIVFRGPVESHKWPEDLRAIFSKICEIGTYNYAQRRAEGKIKPTMSIYGRVKSLKKSSASLRREPANESTLRANTEHIFGDSFSEKPTCSTCRSKRLPENLAWPLGKEGLELMEDFVAKETGCRCSVLSQSIDDSNDQGELNTFINADSEIVKPHDAEIADIKSKVGDKRPDRIYGLNQTPTISQCINRFGAIRHHPCPNRRVLYPFLIIEAKSGIGSATFYDIELQTAFPIRTCVQLQDTLQKMSGVHIRPLVWFLPYQGDEYRLSACTLEDGKTLIYDLWMGRATSSSGALQLLSLVDFISIWARDVYKLGISACLAKGWENLKKLSATSANRDTADSMEVLLRFTETDIDDQVNTAPKNYDQITAPVIDLTMGGCHVNHYRSGSIYEDAAGTGDSYFQPGLQRQLELPSFTTVDSAATVRHINLASLHFSQYTLPEERSRLLHYLRNIRDMEGDTIQSIARDVRAAFLDRKLALSLTNRDIEMIRIKWMKQQLAPSKDPHQLSRVIIGFRTELRKNDWQVVRELWILSCTSTTLQHLSSIAGMTDNIMQVVEDLVPPRGFPMETIVCLRELAGDLALTAALQHLSLLLTLYRDDENNVEYEWRLPISHVTPTAWLLHLMAQGALSGTEPPELIDESHVIAEVIGKSIPPALVDLFSPRITALHGAILLHKATDWPMNSTDWCLMIVNDFDFDQNGSLAPLLFEVSRSFDVITMVAAGFHRGRPNMDAETVDQEHRFLESWIWDLCGQ